MYAVEEKFDLTGTRSEGEEHLTIVILALALIYFINCLHQTKMVLDIKF